MHSALHTSLNATTTTSLPAAAPMPALAGGSAGVPATPLQMQLLYASVGQYDCGSRTRASLAQAADGSIEETLSREMAMETLSLEDGSSSVSSGGGQRDDVISIVSSSSDGRQNL